MKIGNVVIKYNAEMHLTKDQISLLNQNNIDWFPSMDIRQANAGWIWFDDKDEYKKAKKILKEFKKQNKRKRSMKNAERITLLCKNFNCKVCR